MKKLLLCVLILMSSSLLVAEQVELKLVQNGQKPAELPSQKLTSEMVLIEENFSDCASEVLPAGWMTTGTDPSYWVPSNSNYATFVSGHEGEVQYWPAAGASHQDTARLVSPKIATQGKCCLLFSFNYGIFYKAMSDEDDSVEVGLAYKTSDGEWTKLWSANHISDVTQDNYGNTYSIYSNGEMTVADSVQFSFYFKGNTKDLVVWVVDDLQITAAAENDIEVTSQEIVGQFQSGESFQPEATFTSKGSETATFTAKCVISNNGTEVYNETHSVTDLTFFENQTVTFPEFTVSENNKAYKIEYISTLTGDENSVNDTLTAWVDSNTGEKISVVWEEFTGTWCGFCKAINPAIADFAAENSEVITIFTHIGDDYEVSGGGTKAADYGVASYPTCVIEGTVTSSFRSDVYTLSSDFTTNTLNKMSIGTPYNINATSEFSGDGFSTELTVEMIGENSYPGNIRLRVAALEEITFNDGGQSGSVSYTETVLRKYYPHVNGTEIALSKGETETYTIDGDYNDSWNVQNVEVVAYIQNDNNNQILQAVRIGKYTNTDEREEMSHSFELKQNFPNPFNPTTEIAYSIPKKDQVIINIYDIQGKKVKTLVNSQITAGNYQVTWDAKNDLGKVMPAGLYFYKLQTTNQVQTQKMILVK